MLHTAHTAIPDHKLCAAGNDRSNQPLDILSAVLIVGVGVDDDVGAQVQGVLQAGYEGAGQTLILPQAEDVVHTVGLCNLSSTVCAPIVDHQQLNALHPRQRLGKILECSGQGALFVVAWNLDDKLHAVSVSPAVTGTGPRLGDAPMGHILPRGMAIAKLPRDCERGRVMGPGARYGLGPARPVVRRRYAAR